MIIRHDIDDQAYLDLGKQYSLSVAYIGGGAGTLIHPDWIVTAAHCVPENECHMFVTHTDKAYRIESIARHPDWDDRTQAHDIALIQLKDPIENGKPVNLYDTNDENGKPVVFVGRGEFGNGKKGAIADDKKERGATNTIDYVSELLIGFRFNPPESATRFEGISGDGDSGGPALIEQDTQLFVAGISSYQKHKGLKKGTYGVLEYYTRVSVHIPWIESAIKNSQPATIPDHPVIDAIKNNIEQHLKQAVNSKVVDQNEIMTEAFYQTLLLDRVNLAAELIAQGANINSLMMNQTSLFEAALHYKREQYFHMLLNKFSQAKNIHQMDSVVLPLYIFTFGDDPQAIDNVKQLLNQGANINAQFSEGDTALFISVWETDNLDLVAFLIEQGADVNCQDDNGNIPLMAAAYFGKNRVMKYLLVNGSNVNNRNKDRESAFYLARKKKNMRTMG